MTKDNRRAPSDTPEERVKQIADLAVTALRRLQSKDCRARGFSGQVGLDKTGETRVYDHPLESRGGRL